MARRRDPLSGLKQVSSDTTDLFESLSRASEKASGRKSEALFGVFGGGFGLGAGFALSLAVHAVPFFIGGPIGAVTGIPVAILLWRGPGRFRQERKLESTRIVLDEIEARIKALPKDTPKHIRERLWEQYESQLAELSPPTPLPAPRQRALPPASDPPLSLPKPVAQPMPTETPLPPADAS